MRGSSSCSTTAVQFDSAHITAPERIYFDLHGARLDPSVAQKTVPAGDGLLKWVRAAQNTDDVVRLVLDADKAKDYSAQLLSDPYRLVIDVSRAAEGRRKERCEFGGGAEKRGQPSAGCKREPRKSPFAHAGAGAEDQPHRDRSRATAVLTRARWDRTA